ncbi:hypothetical protein Tco_0027502 [Tanacetum coccineum]
MTKKIVQIKKCLLTARSRQKSYADRRNKPLEFEVGDMVLLKVSSWKGVIRFGKRQNLSPRYIRPFKILARVGPVAYTLELPKEFQGIHSTFHVSNLKKCLADENLIIPLDEIQLDDKLHFIEEPVEIVDQEISSETSTLTSSPKMKKRISQIKHRDGASLSGKGHYARNFPKPRVRDSKYVMEQMLLAKQDEARVNLTDEQNDFLFTDASRMEEIEDLVQSSSITENEEQMNVNSGSIKKDTHVPDLCALEQLARNAYHEAEKQQIFAQKVQKQNTTLTSQLELYKERVRVLENINGDLEAKQKKNVDLILKLGNSLQGMFMLGPKTLSVYDQQLKHGLGYPNPYTLKQAISQCPKLYLASSLGNLEISLNVRDTEDTLDDASKSQQKVYEKNK